MYDSSVLFSPHIGLRRLSSHCPKKQTSKIYPTPRRLFPYSLHRVFTGQDWPTDPEGARDSL